MPAQRGLVAHGELAPRGPFNESNGDAASSALWIRQRRCADWSFRMGVILTPKVFPVDKLSTGSDQSGVCMKRADIPRDVVNLLRRRVLTGLSRCGSGVAPIRTPYGV